MHDVAGDIFNHSTANKRLSLSTTSGSVAGSVNSRPRSATNQTNASLGMLCRACCVVFDVVIFCWLCT